jgi:hypothetical protein
MFSLSRALGYCLIYLGIKPTLTTTSLQTRMVTLTFNTSTTRTYLRITESNAGPGDSFFYSRKGWISIIDEGVGTESNEDTDIH